MYNFTDSSIPVFFPILEGVSLQTWFDPPLLDEGLKLIREQEVTCFHSIGDTVGCLAEDEYPVILRFEKTSKLRQGFMLRESLCSKCYPGNREKRCVHMASLAILSLFSHDEEDTAKPLSFDFKMSPWAKLGECLYDWLSRVKYTFLLNSAGEANRWVFSAGDGRLEISIPPEWQRQGEFLLKGKGWNVPMGSPALTRLFTEMSDLAMSTNERMLQEAGSSSKGWQKDISLWMWIAKLFFLRSEASYPQFARESGSQGFSIKSGAASENAAFALYPPKQKTWDFIRGVYGTSGRVPLLPAAKECYQVSFGKDNSLSVVPSLLLEDRRVLSRKELAPNRFQSVYYLEEEGFQPVTRLPQEATLVQPNLQTESLPLLGFIKNEESRHEPFSIGINDIPAFLKTNRQALRHPVNIVEPALLDFQLHELPDRLIVDAFSEQDKNCYLTCRYGVGETILHLHDIIEALNRNFSSIPGRVWLQLRSTPLTWYYELARKRWQANEPDTIRLDYRELLSLKAIVPKLDLCIGDDEGKQRLTKLLDVDDLSEKGLPASVPDHLRSYQCNGLVWLSRLYRMGIGGILADDMGLGKTHQGLALLQAALAENSEAAQLVVCPTTVLLNWKEKISRFFPDLPYKMYYGSQRSLTDVIGHGLILTTYGMIRQDAEQLQAHSFDIIMLDEIQHVKNKDTVVHRAVASLNGTIKIGLTGTPIENSLGDLHSLFAICLPGLLGNRKHFDKYYLYPITEHHSQQAKERLGRLIYPFMLRRTRSQVLEELPDTIEDNLLCELSNDQITFYRDVSEGSMPSLFDRTEEGDKVPYIHILAMITKLKQICCHPCLITDCDDPDRYESGKWNLFVELATELLDGGMKFVVFSQYLGMLDLIEKHFYKKGVRFASLKGQMSVSKRQQMIDQFNTDPECKVFCASLLAGGTGIDLTAGHAVIHYDRWWNPAREEQATARVHRMGQKNVVQVFRLITEGTLEEKIHRLINDKKELAESLIREDEAAIIKRLDREQLANLLRLN